MNVSKREQQLFEEARDLKDTQARQAYLDQACVGDEALRRSVEALLAADAGAESFFADGSLALHQSVLSMAEPEQPGDRIGPSDAIGAGRYKLLEKIGEGGCGTVYMAEQEQPVRRRVALKIIKLGMDSRSVVARFEAERQALALMEHPNIARIYDAGAIPIGPDRDRPYFVMELVRGVKITEYCDDQQLSTRERLELFLKVCDAVQHAHQKGVIHRDLKPSNVLVTVNDGVAVPKVIDFGIAKAVQGRLTDQTLFTGFEQLLGTPAYMSPEQALMSSVDVDTRSDIYSLGVLLYELLTGQTPFDARTLLQEGIDKLRQTIRERDPLRPSTRLRSMSGEELTTAARRRRVEVPRLLQRVSGDLDWIVMKCLDKDRACRYETANGLAADIKRHLNHEPVVARPISAVARLTRWCRRSPRLAWAVGVGTALLLVILIGSPLAAVRINRARVAAEEARRQEESLRRRAEAAERETERQLYAALLQQTRATRQSGELGQRVRALEAIQRAAAISNSTELRQEAFATLALPDLRFEKEWPYGAEFTVREPDPTFARIALGRGAGPIEIRDLREPRLLATLPASTKRPAHDAEWSADGRFLSIKRDRTANGARADWEVWEVAVPRRILLLQNVSVGAISFHPRLPQIITGENQGEVLVRSLENGKKIRRFEVEGLPAFLRFDPAGDRIAAVCEVGNDLFLSIHNATNGAVLSSRALADFVSDLTWHPSGRWLAVPDHSGAVNLVDAQTGKARLLGHHKAQAVLVSFSPDGAWLLSGDWQKELICWNTRAMRRAFTIPLDSFLARFSSDGRACAVMRATGIHRYRFEPPGCREFTEDLGPHLRYASFSQDGRWLAVSAEKSAGVWDLATGGAGAVDKDGYDAHFFFTPDGSELFGSRASLKEPACLRWRLAPASSPEAPPRIMRLPLTAPRQFTYLGLISNSIVWTGTNGSQILSLKSASAYTEQAWRPTPAGINGASPDGRWLGIYRPYTPTLWVYKLPGLEPMTKITLRANIRDFHFSPQANELAISSHQGVEFWSAETWQRTRVLTNYIHALYMPDGRSLWLSPDLRSSGLYDAGTLELLLPLPKGTLPLAQSRDARHLAVSVDADRLQMWDLVEVRKQFRELGIDWAHPSAGPDQGNVLPRNDQGTISKSAR